jgi:hypothetical protein
MKFDYTQKNIEYVIKLIRENLTPDLLASKFKKINETNSMYGHCKHASQALILLMNTNRLQLMKNSSHVWVQDEDKIYDVTSDQFYLQGLTPCYENATVANYAHTVKADILIEKVLRTHFKLAQGSCSGQNYDL